MAAKKKGTLKKFTFGTCSYNRTSPSRRDLSPRTKSLNILVPFNEAVKLHLAVLACAQALNEYKRSTSAGKRAALNLTIHFDIERIAINEGTVRESESD